MKKCAEDAEAQLSSYKQRAEQAEENATKKLRLRRSLGEQAQAVLKLPNTQPILQLDYDLSLETSALISLGDDEGRLLAHGRSYRPSDTLTI